MEHSFMIKIYAKLTYCGYFFQDFVTIVGIFSHLKMFKKNKLNLASRLKSFHPNYQVILTQNTEEKFIPNPTKVFQLINNERN